MPYIYYTWRLTDLRDELKQIEQLEHKEREYVTDLNCVSAPPNDPGGSPLSV